MIIQPRTLTDEEREKGALVSHKLWERARVDIVKI
jgi:DNA polymerase alpha subunit B